MAYDAQKKIFAGPRIRRLRRELGLTQSRMASELGFSASYLNLVERNQRPVTAQFLLRMAEVYDIELRSLAGDEEAKAFADLNEVLSDPLFRSLGLSKSEIQEFASAGPNAVEAFTLLYRNYIELRERTDELSLQMTGAGQLESEEAVFPVDEVRDFIHAHRNHFPELDEAAELLHEKIGLSRDHAYSALCDRLRDEHGIRVQVMDSYAMPETLRLFDPHRARLFLSEFLERPGRNIQIAYQIGLLEHGELIKRLVKAGSFSNPESERLCRISLANYFAAALLMPYEAFRSDADALSYDIEHLGARYGASFEQVCHRLTTLQRAGMRGIPFFFIRVDNAGNVSKRFSAGKFHFSRFGGACPLWNVHDTFSLPGRIFTQIIRMPDETTYFSVARTVRRAGSPFSQPEQQLAIGLGCEIQYANKLVYAKGYNIENPEATPVGPNCRLCERPNCAQRAHPPIARGMLMDERSRGVSPFRFALE